MSAPRRTISELAFLYSKEPGIFDIFVEGISDSGLLRWVLENTDGTQHAKPYPIDSIDVPRDIVEKWGLLPNNRNEVIALCLELESKGVTLMNVCGIIDHDFDSFLTPAHRNQLVLATDFASLDMYFWSQSAVQKVLEVSFTTVSLDASNLWHNLISVAQDVFFIHLTIRELIADYKWLTPDKFIRNESGTLTFLGHQFLTELLRMNLSRVDAESFRQRLEFNRARRTPEPRLQMHPDELKVCFGLILKDEVKKTHDKDRCRPDALHYSLRLCSELNSLRNQPMFAELLRRIITSRQQRA